MKRLITYSTLALCTLLIMSLRSKTETTSKNFDKTIKYYFHDHSCLNVTKRCALDIVKLIDTDTLIYVSSSEHFKKYEELWGKLTQINDSIYHVKCFRYVEQALLMPLFGKSDDTLTFFCDSSLIGKTFKIEYFNEATVSHRINSIMNRFHIDKNLFNSEYKKIRVSFEYPHPIVNEIVELPVTHHSDLTFTTRNRPNDFYVIINESQIKSINPSQSNRSIGPTFTLNQKPVNAKLNRGRTIRQ